MNCGLTKECTCKYVDLYLLGSVKMEEAQEGRTRADAADEQVLSRPADGGLCVTTMYMYMYVYLLHVSVHGHACFGLPEVFTCMYMYTYMTNHSNRCLERPSFFPSVSRYRRNWLAWNGVHNFTHRPVLWRRRNKTIRNKMRQWRESSRHFSKLVQSLNHSYNIAVRDTCTCSSHSIEVHVN